MRIEIYVATQTLDLLSEQGELLQRYPVSTAAKGCGERKGSYQTPRGRHVIRAKIGDGQPLNAVFRARRPTGEIFDEALDRQYPERDWILSRILWLSGREPGFNRLGPVDTMQRFIYLHGTPERGPFGIPASHGCVRMHNDDIVELFERVPVLTPVHIHAEALNRTPSLQCVRFGLTTWDEADDLRQLRYQVFVAEQGVPLELEVDEQDPGSLHWTAIAPSGRVIACVRLTPEMHIGRLAVDRAWRGVGIGRRLLELAIEAARRTGASRVDLNAQLTALGFYAARGFQARGEVFDDAGIPHQNMVLGLS